MHESRTVFILHTLHKRLSKRSDIYRAYSRIKCIYNAQRLRLNLSDKRRDDVSCPFSVMCMRHALYSFCTPYNNSCQRDLTSIEPTRISPRLLRRLQLMVGKCTHTSPRKMCPKDGLWQSSRSSQGLCCATCEGPPLLYLRETVEDADPLVGRAILVFECSNGGVPLAISSRSAVVMK